tara:strand:+ start:273 stop:500 length:228 start_codon:yes stop_codon:yes gene_type:complete
MSDSIDQAMLDQLYPQRTLSGATARDIRLYSDETEEHLLVDGVELADDTMTLIWRDAEKELEKKLKLSRWFKSSS